MPMATSDAFDAEWDPELEAAEFLYISRGLGVGTWGSGSRVEGCSLGLKVFRAGLRMSVLEYIYIYRVLVHGFSSVGFY